MDANQELAGLLPVAWRDGLQSTVDSPDFARLAAFLQEEWQQADIFPPREQIFAALALTAPSDVRVVILGQDPYHGAGQAHGLAFSVQPGVKPPPSLRNIFRELHSDLKIAPPAHGSLLRWAQQGVLLLNTVLTVRAGAANSHRKQGWETLTDAIMQMVAARREHTAFVLWGAPARKKRPLIEKAAETADAPSPTIIESAHPSPLSAHNGFLGSRPFSQVNTTLQAHGQTEVDWSLD